MNTYIAFYKGKKIEIQSDTTYHAQQEAAKKFGVGGSKSYTVTVMLAEKDGKTVIHVADF